MNLNYYDKYNKYQNKLHGGMGFFSKKSTPIPNPPQMIIPDTSSLTLIDTNEFKYEELSVKIEKYKGNVFVPGDSGNGAYWQSAPDSVVETKNSFIYILVDDKYVLFLNHQCHSEIVNKSYLSKIPLNTLEKLKIYICELSKKEEKQEKIKNEQDILKSKLELFDSNPRNDPIVKTEIDKITQNIEKNQKICNELPTLIANKDENINKFVRSVRGQIIAASDSRIEWINKYGF
jgi:hypothetical protein